ncbi:MAG: 4Fe-4S binding protein [Candidatus Euphemobacter frigidus]|nr:4Fe-4S binding protein [Candidatus Euphemobacter frigidus]MDP8275468.1 4Fe-4S binding protein [Candidatus Euphemobacter frigidus]
MISKRIVLHFPRDLVSEPTISRLVKKYDLECNILRANITPRQVGIMVLGLKGGNKQYKDAIVYLKSLNITVQPLSQDVTWNEDLCTDCGACVTICPTEALTKDPNTQKVRFDKDACIGCELCIPACPMGAMEVHF